MRTRALLLVAAALRAAAQHERCKPYCGAASSRICARLDCAACAGCNHSAAALAQLNAAAGDEANVTCDADGSFAVPETRWPAPYHMLDAGVAAAAQRLVGAAGLLDVGAGSGQYGAWFEARRRAGDAAVPAWSGVDGARNIERFTRRMGPPGARVTHANLCDANLSLRAREWAMSLEVGEHLPSGCIGAYTRTLSRAATRGLLVSWAHEHQGGKCHISTRSASWVEKTFQALGWTVHWPSTRAARASAELPWLRKNLFVLRRPPCGDCGVAGDRRVLGEAERSSRDSQAQGQG